MKVVYAREGGLFPQVAETEATTADLSIDLQKLAAAVLADPRSYTSRSANPNLRDGYQYRLMLQEGSKKVNLTFDDSSLPAAIQPLVEFLQQRTGKP